MQKHKQTKNKGNHEVLEWEDSMGCRGGRDTVVTLQRTRPSLGWPQWVLGEDTFTNAWTLSRASLTKDVSPLKEAKSSPGCP